MQITKSIYFLAARGVQLDNEVTPPPYGDIYLLNGFLKRIGSWNNGKLLGLLTPYGQL